MLGVAPPKMAVNNGAVESESVGDLVQRLGGDERSVGLWTAFLMGSKTQTLLPQSI